MLVDFTSKRDRTRVERLRSGDREALAELYRTHHAAVHRFAVYLTADPQAAVEITQDVFVWLMDHADRFDPLRGALASFLGGVARKFASRRRVAVRRFELLHQPIDLHAPAVAQAENAAGNGRVPQLRKAIAALPPLYREAVAICDLEGMSYEEAAAVLACPVGTGRSRLHRARALLARQLAGQGEDLCNAPIAAKSAAI